MFKSLYFILLYYTVDFTVRKSNHKHVCNNANSEKYNLKIYKIIRENGGWDEWQIIQIEVYPCLSGIEASARERYFYEQFQTTLNNNVPGQTQKEWYVLNKDTINEHQKTKNICNCGGKFTTANKLQHIKSIKHLKYIQAHETIDI